ncbi:phosphotransferase [Flexivirga alba]|uniref:Phosphotransferase n=1 Tax=Flexivirga alba TaxID=702742 RepID=A0ABW2AB26_9MICO
MELIASGRAADVFDAGPGRVLRRYRIPGLDTAKEAEIMQHVARAGYPVPAVYDADGPDLVLERIEGSSMLDALQRAPWRLRRYARQLAELHARLGAITAPPGLWQPLGPGTDLMHLDLHPDNVILAPSGPVVIDWTNAAGGTAAADVADTWLLLACARPVESSRVLVAAQRAFAAAFIAAADRASAREQLHAVFAHRIQDRNMQPEEVARMRRLVARETGRDPES